MSRFGPFASVFESGEYLTLLHMSSDAQIAIDRIEQIIGTYDAIPWIRILFEKANWRPHLVGAMALLLDGGRASGIDALWRAIDRGSWVNPQLVVAAYFRDPNFSIAALTRITTRPRRFNSKTLSSLLQIAAEFPSLSALIKEVQEGRDGRDQAAATASHWKKEVITEFARRGRFLVPLTMEERTAS